MEKIYDVIIVGSGITGSLGAVILKKLGYKVLMLEKSKHPRFALGESATPLTTHYFERFSKQFDIPELMSFSSYGKMRQERTEMNCGPKELFYYMKHHFDKPVNSIDDVESEVVVQTRTIDLQYDRAELDEYVVKLAVKMGVDYIDEFTVDRAEFTNEYAKIIGTKADQEYQYKGQFLIDATGYKSFLANQFDLRLPTEEIQTPLATRCIFTHVKGVKSLEEVLNNNQNFNENMTVHRSRGTQHHVFDGGWYWFIPFDNGITSIGLSLDLEKYPENDLSGEEEFRQITSRLPLVNQLLESTQAQMPYIKTGRLQFQNKQFAGERWALLPASAFGMDAWQSTGMTVSFMALDRLIWNLDNIIFPYKRFEASVLASYEKQLRNEFYHITRFIHGIYKSFKHYELFRVFCLLPFLGIEKFVIDGGLSRPWDENAILMNFGNPHWRESFYRLYNHVLECNKQETLSQQDIDKARSIILEEMSMYNSRNYGCPSMGNIYLKNDSDADRRVGLAMTV